MIQYQQLMMIGYEKIRYYTNEKYSLYLFIVISCLIQGCYNDKGNYDYRSPEECAPAIVSELKESYEATSLQQFVLEPDVEMTASIWNTCGIFFRLPTPIYPMTRSDMRGNSIIL